MQGWQLTAGDHFNIKMPSYQYRDPHVKDKMVSHLGKTVFILKWGSDLPFTGQPRLASKTEPVQDICNWVLIYEPNWAFINSPANVVKIVLLFPPTGQRVMTKSSHNSSWHCPTWPWSGNHFTPIFPSVNGHHNSSSIDISIYSCPTSDTMIVVKFCTWRQLWYHRKALHPFPATPYIPSLFSVPRLFQVSCVTLFLFQTVHIDWLHIISSCTGATKGRECEEKCVVCCLWALCIWWACLSLMKIPVTGVQAIWV